MTDKVQKIREEVERLKESGCASPIVICDTLLAFIDSMQEEPVSDDLDIAIGEYCSNPDNFITYIDVAFAYRSEQKDDIPLIIKAIKFGANWQKKQCNNEANHALVEQIKTQQLCYEKGMADMKQQMMKDAVDGRFSYNHNFKENEFICLEKSDTPEHYLGELVKVIIIKQKEK